MKRTATFGNSIGTLTVTIEGYGKMKQEIGDDEFGEFLDHEADFTALLLQGVLMGLTASGSGTRRSSSSFEIEQDGTHYIAGIDFQSYRPVDADQLDRLMGALTLGIRTHARMHLAKQEPLDPSFGAGSPFDLMDGLDSLSGLFNGERSSGKSSFAGLLGLLLGDNDLDLMDERHADGRPPFGSGLGYSAGDPRHTPWGPRY